MSSAASNRGAGAGAAGATLKSGKAQRISSPSASIHLPCTPYITHIVPVQAGYAEAEAEAEAEGCSHLVVGSSDGSVRLHQCASLEPMAELPWHLLPSSSSSASSNQGAISALLTLPSASSSTGSSSSSISNAQSSQNIRVLCATNQGCGAILWHPFETAAAQNSARPSENSLKQLKSSNGAPYLCLACSSDGRYVAAGTEVKNYEAVIDLWDLLSSTSSPQFTYTESHSDDITSLSFHPSHTHRHLLLSGSTDGLLSVLDTRTTDEDDAVLGVCNMDASIARAGWCAQSSACDQSGMLRARKEEALFSGVDATMNMQEEEELNVKEERAKGMGDFWSVSDMQSVAIWNENFDAVLQPLDVRSVGCREWQTDYIIDAFSPRKWRADGARSRHAQATRLIFWVGTISGKALRIDLELDGQDGSTGWTMKTLLSDSDSDSTASAAYDAVQVPQISSPLRSKGHSDIVRSIHQAGEARQGEIFIFTGGEDARRLCK
ncbi:WD40 repeat protein [Ceraceosorus bombacis]|uniref:WD40 repeat protein n=1 Tax=Ceraceosorus bombacis TaxID=401625 RepID=A0A0P1B9L8_9BASI|nr:WD40 repeat protein [Ceraceosorus bombacis]